ncbi:MAG: aminotransferase class IV [Chryseolinea sp.]
MNSKFEAQFAFVGNQIVRVSDASVHISDLAVQRGYGIFDFFKIKGDHPYFLEYHLDRFYDSASIMKLKAAQSRADLTGIISELITRNAIDESGIKVILTGGYSPDGYQIAAPNLILTQHPLTLPSSDQIENGISVITHSYNKEFPEAKTINYTMGIWLVDRIKAEGASDVLYHHNNILSEFPRCNLFIVDQNGVVKTPAKNILKGVTRKNILKLSSTKYTTQETDISIDELFAAREVFLTSTTKRVLPIVSVDHKPIGDGKPGPVSMILLRELLELEKKNAQGQ